MTLKELSKTFRSIADAIDGLLGLENQLQRPSRSVAKELIEESGLVRRKGKKARKKMSKAARRKLSKVRKEWWKKKKAGEV